MFRVMKRNTRYIQKIILNIIYQIAILMWNYQIATAR